MSAERNAAPESADSSRFDEGVRARVHEELAALVARLDPALLARLDDPEARGESGTDLVRATGVVADEAQELLRSAVAAARDTGASWATIGRVLGISRQAAQQRFGKEEDARSAPPSSGSGESDAPAPTSSMNDPWTADDGRIWRMTPVDAFDELPRLERAGRRGWRSIGYGILYHDLVHTDVQWEHKRVTALNNPRARLEAEGWRVIGTSWFPWVYYARPTDRPAEGDGSIPE
ncbi:hypothetical protein [Actinomyces culturomici]|uniref:hypothetical protein n=1 Tax=Actinomyces culturomici TaxID=1926276 RepID=UPI000E208BB4|nr:hypothetical protein [Actinomyces culturomici]